MGLILGPYVPHNAQVIGRGMLLHAASDMIQIAKASESPVGPLTVAARDSLPTRHLLAHRPTEVFCMTKTTLPKHTKINHPSFQKVKMPV